MSERAASACKHNGVLCSVCMRVCAHTSSYWRAFKGVLYLLHSACARAHLPQPSRTHPQTASAARPAGGPCAHGHQLPRRSTLRPAGPALRLPAALQPRAQAMKGWGQSGVCACKCCVPGPRQAPAMPSHCHARTLPARRCSRGDQEPSWHARTFRSWQALRGGGACAALPLLPPPPAPLSLIPPLAVRGCSCQPRPRHSQGHLEVVGLRHAQGQLGRHQGGMVLAALRHVQVAGAQRPCVGTRSPVCTRCCGGVVRGAAKGRARARTCTSTRSALGAVSGAGSVARATSAGMESHGAVRPPRCATSTSSSTRLRQRLGRAGQPASAAAGAGRGKPARRQPTAHHSTSIHTWMCRATCSHS